MEFAGDAGNRLTVLFLSEAALALATQLDELPQRGGLLTPATALGQVFLDRTRSAGVSWQIDPG